MTVSPFDFSLVLAPLPGVSPTGPSLRYDPVYDAIREARRQDDVTLPVGIWQSAAKRADWDESIRLCRDVLETRSKDVQIACWLVEALVHRHGFGALGPALRMLDGLCAAFWDGLHPEIDDGDIAARVAPLEWLNGKLPALLHMQPVTRSGSQPVLAYSYSDYENAQRRQLAATRDPRGMAAALGKGEALLPDIEASALATPVAFHRLQHAQFAEAIAAIDALSALFDERCGRQAPGLMGLRNACVGLQGWVDTALRAKGEDPEPAAAPAAPPAAESGDAEADGPPDGPPDGADDDGPPIPDGGPIRSRDEAYYWLAAAADFLMQAEPHSPTPYLINRALNWANMPLHEVLLEVSRGRNDLAAVFDFLGFNFSEMCQKDGERKEK